MPMDEQTKAKALLARRWGSAQKMANTSWEEWAAVLKSAGYPEPEKASTRLGEEMLGRLAGALAPTDARDGYDRIRQAVL